MTLRKITIDNSVKLIPESEQCREKFIRSNMIKNISLPKKEKNSQNNQNFILKFLGEGFTIFKRITNRHF